MELEMDNYRSKEQRAISDAVMHFMNTANPNKIYKVAAKEKKEITDKILLSEIEGKKRQLYNWTGLGILGGTFAARDTFKQKSWYIPGEPLGKALLRAAAHMDTSMLIGGSIGFGSALLANAIGTHLGHRAKPRTKEEQAEYENGGYEDNYWIAGLGAYNLARRKNKNL